MNYEEELKACDELDEWLKQDREKFDKWYYEQLEKPLDEKEGATNEKDY